MAFSASKKRERRKDPLIMGKPMTPSSAIEIWYRDQLQRVTKSMIEDYREQVGAALREPSVREVFVQDAAAASTFKSLFERMDAKWEKIYAGFAKIAAGEFVDKSAAYADSSAGFSISHMGIEAPVMAYNSNIANTISASKDYNFTLITGLQEEIHEKIYTSVMLSLTSPNPEEQGQSGIQNTLKEIGGFSKERIKLIASDQTSKVYSSLSDERMRQNGLDKFMWLHSSAGKVPRQSHVEKDGQIFSLDDPRLWEGKKSDQGPPGWAIRCRCRKIPVLTND
jgi:SPP1 gp7 family putative phage head morphogenesis protein